MATKIYKVQIVFKGLGPIDPSTGDYSDAVIAVRSFPHLSERTAIERAAKLNDAIKVLDMREYFEVAVTEERAYK